MPTEKPQRSATPGSLLSQWWSLGALTREKRARTRHWRAAWIIFDRYMQRRGKGRASVRYISKATGMSQRAVVSACRELTEWGYTQRIVGSGSRPSEYMPNWTTTPPFTVQSPDFEVVSGTHDDSTIATHEGHTKSVSGTHGGRESDLPLTGVKAELEVVSAKVSASGPGAVPAPAVAGIDFERCWRAYGKYGNKAASRLAFDAITNPDVDLIAQRAAAWCASAKPGQRRMPFERWLAAEKWDEADRRSVAAPTTQKQKPPEPWHDFTIVSGETNECGDASLRVIFHDESEEPQRWPLPQDHIDTLLKVCGGEQNAVGARMRFRVRPDESLEFAVSPKSANDNRKQDKAV